MSVRRDASASSPELPVVSSAHRVRRAVIAASILLLGLVAASRLRVTYAPQVSRPAMTIDLWLPSDASSDPEELTRRFVVPVEAAVRSLGHVSALAGEVGPSQAHLTVRFEAGTDAEVKASRLVSELGALRRRLPDGATLDVVPVVESGGAFGVLALSGTDDPRSIDEVADRLRAVPGVRDVTVAGAAGEELAVTLRPGIPATAVARATALVERSFAARHLGDRDASGRREAVVSVVGHGLIADLPLLLGERVVPLGDVADITQRPAEPAVLAHLDGRRAVVLRVTAEHDASLLGLHRALLRRAEEIGRMSAGRLTVTLVQDQAQLLATLLARIGLALAACVLLAGAAGGVLAGAAGAVRLAMAVPLGVAVALNAAWLTGAALDATTILALALGVIASLPIPVLRLRRRSAGLSALATVAGCGALLPLVLAACGGRLAPDLLPGARMFAWSLAGGAAVAFVFPAGGERARSPRVGRILRRLLRHPPTVLLVGVTALHGLLTLFGPALDPRAGGRISADEGRLAVRLQLPVGTTLAETERVTARAERMVHQLPAIQRSWSWIGEGEAGVFLDVRRDARTPGKLRELQTDLTYALASLGAVVDVSEAPSAPGVLRGELGSDLVDRPEADQEATRYRLLLRSLDAATLRAAAERIRLRAGAIGIPQGWIRAEWGAPSLRVELAPRADATTEQLHALVEDLRARTVPPTPLRIPDRPHAQVVVSAPGMLRREDDVPQRADLLAAPLRGSAEPRAVAALVRDVERSVLPPLTRESGRFVLPMTVAFQHRSQDRNRDLRDKLHRSLSVLEVPAGCDVERPEIGADAWPVRRLRVIGLAVAVPTLLLLAAAFRLGSFRWGLTALLPVALGVAFAAPVLGLRSLALDELALLLVAAAACAALASVLLVAARARAPRGRSPTIPAYRAGREALPALVVGAGGLAVLAASCAGLDVHAATWVGPLQAASAAAASALLASALLVPSTALFVAAWTRRGEESARRLRRPPQWLAPDGPPVLTVRRVTKVYRTGLRALHDVSFELRPGIVGLVGPNGAGKTTLLRILTGLLSPSRGQVLLRGVPVLPENLAVYRRDVGFLPQDFNAYPGLTAEQFLDYWAIERGMHDNAARAREVAGLLRDVALEGDARRMVRDFSGGMRQRLGIARALLGAPPILVVDEPTTGLDVESRTRFRETLLAVAAERIVVLSTHVAGDVEAAASRLLLLHRGRLCFDGAPSDLVARARGRTCEALVPDAELREFGRRYRVTARVRVLDGIRVRAVVPAGAPLPGPAVEPTLEEGYLATLDLVDPGRADGSRFGFLGRRAPDLK